MVPLSGPRWATQMEIIGLVELLMHTVPIMNTLNAWGAGWVQGALKMISVSAGHLQRYYHVQGETVSLKVYLLDNLHRDGVQ